MNNGKGAAVRITNGSLVFCGVVKSEKPEGLELLQKKRLSDASEPRRGEIFMSSIILRKRFKSELFEIFDAISFITTPTNCDYKPS